MLPNAMLFKTMLQQQTLPGSLGFLVLLSACGVSETTPSANPPVSHQAKPNVDVDSETRDCEASAQVFSSTGEFLFASVVEARSSGAYSMTAQDPCEVKVEDLLLKSFALESMDTFSFPLKVVSSTPQFGFTRMEILQPLEESSEVQFYSHRSEGAVPFGHPNRVLSFVFWRSLRFEESVGGVGFRPLDYALRQDPSGRIRRLANASELARAEKSSKNGVPFLHFVGTPEGKLARHSTKSTQASSVSPQVSLPQFRLLDSGKLEMFFETTSELGQVRTRVRLTYLDTTL